MPTNQVAIQIEPHFLLVMIRWNFLLAWKVMH